MSFLRHGESIDPMNVYATGSKHRAHSQCSSASMSSSRLFLGRLLSSRACLRFADRERFSKTKPRRTMIFQRTATTPLTPCLSSRVQSTETPPAVIMFGLGLRSSHPCLSLRSIHHNSAHSCLDRASLCCRATRRGGAEWRCVDFELGLIGGAFLSGTVDMRFDES
jgi:hypothetical protein